MTRRSTLGERNRGIPEATVARLPVYLRALHGLADRGVATVSSEELAAAAGVNSAKLRKDLSHLGSYGTRGVGYEVEYLVYQISRELGLTQDWAVAIVGGYVSGLIPEGVFAGLHASRLDGANLNQLRGQVEQLQTQAAELRQEDVFERREMGGKAGLLRYHRHAGRKRITRRIEVDIRAGEDQLAAVGAVHAGQNP